MSAVTSGNGVGDPPPGDPTGPADRPRPGRGIVIVIVAVVIGALLLPSATRAPLPASASTGAGTAASATTTTTLGTTTVPSTGRSTTPKHGKHGSTTTTTTTVAPSAVHVLVANATSTNGVAGAVTRFLASKGFATLTAVNALLKVTATQLYTVGGATADTTSVATALSLPTSSIEPAASAAPVSSSAGANVVVIVGPDLALRFAPGTTATSG